MTRIIIWLKLDLKSFARSNSTELRYSCFSKRKFIGTRCSKLLSSKQWALYIYGVRKSHCSEFLFVQRKETNTWDCSSSKNTSKIKYDDCTSVWVCEIRDFKSKILDREYRVVVARRSWRNCRGNVIFPCRRCIS